MRAGVLLPARGLLAQKQLSRLSKRALARKAPSRPHGRALGVVEEQSDEDGLHGMPRRLQSSFQ